MKCRCHILCLLSIDTDWLRLTEHKICMYFFILLIWQLSLHRSLKKKWVSSSSTLPYSVFTGQLCSAHKQKISDPKQARHFPRVRCLFMLLVWHMTVWRIRTKKTSKFLWWFLKCIVCKYPSSSRCKVMQCSWSGLSTGGFKLPFHQSVSYETWKNQFV